MKEPNQGISKVCICGKTYWCDDGSPFCSDKCYDQWEATQEENK